MNVQRINDRVNASVQGKQSQSDNSGGSDSFLSMLSGLLNGKNSSETVMAETGKALAKRENGKNKQQDDIDTQAQSMLAAYASQQPPTDVQPSQEAITEDTASVTPKFTIQAAEGDMLPGMPLIMNEDTETVGFELPDSFEQVPDTKETLETQKASVTQEAQQTSVPEVLPESDVQDTAKKLTENTVIQEAEAEMTDDDVVQTMVRTRGSDRTTDRTTGVRKPETALGAGRHTRATDSTEGDVEIQPDSASESRHTRHTARYPETMRPEIMRPESEEGAMRDIIGRATRELRLARNPDTHTELPEGEQDLTATLKGNTQNVVAVAESYSKAERRSEEAAVMLERNERPADRIPARSRQTQTSQETDQEPSVVMSASTPETARMQETRQESPVPQTTRAAQAEQIQAQVLRNLENRSMEFRMTLRPEELGQIDVKMALQGGKLMIEIISSARVSEILSRQTEALAGSLRQNAPDDITSVQVVTEPRSFLGNTDNAFNMNSQNSGQERGEGHGKHNGNHSGQKEFSSELEDAGVKLDASKLLDYAI